MRFFLFPILVLGYLVGVLAASFSSGYRMAWRRFSL